MSVAGREYPRVTFRDSREVSSLVPPEVLDGIRLRHEEIAIRAYALYQERGGSDGSDIEDWFQAERQLLHERRQQLAAV